MAEPGAPGRPLWQRVVLVVAALGFAAGVWLSFRAQPELLSAPRPVPLAVLALVAIPVTVLLNTAEFRWSARLVGRDIPPAQALEVTIVASVANMLPLPGGTLVRIAALKSRGATLREGTTATLLISAIWVGIACLYAGVWVLLSPGPSGPWLGLAFLGFGGVVSAASVGLGLRMPGRRAAVARLALIKVGLVLTDAIRIWLCLQVLSASGDFAQASVLTVSGVAGAAVSVVPAGLGIREGTAALLGPLIALPAAEAYLSISLNRVLGLALLTPVALWLGLRRKPAG